MNFLWKKMRPKSVFWQLWKKLQVRDKFFFRKKISSSLFKHDLQNGAQIFLTNKLVLRYLVLVILRFRKNVLYSKIILIDKKSRKFHALLETIISRIISYDFWKIGLNPEELELLEYALVITFFETKSLGRSF